MEISPQIPQDILCIFRDVLVVFEENEPQPLQMFAFHGIQFGSNSAPHMVELIVHEFDDVEMIEHDLSMGKVFGEPGGIRICHISCNKLQLTYT